MSSGLDGRRGPTVFLREIDARQRCQRLCRSSSLGGPVGRRDPHIQAAGADELLRRAVAAARFGQAERAGELRAHGAASCQI